MTQARVAVGVIAALLVVGAVVHFQPPQRLSADTFVSAALDIDTLSKCEASEGPATEADPGTVLSPFTADWAGTGGAAANRLMVQTKGPCVCNKNICTNGRVCDPAGALGQCYLPRCPAPGNNVPVEYTAGCFCAADAAFTSSDKGKAYVGIPRAEITADVADTATATEVSKCGSEAVCYAGELCSTTPATGTCAGIAKFPQTTAYAIPSISSKVFTNPKLFAICKSTAATTRRCKLPAAPVTQTGETAAVECEVIA